MQKDGLKKILAVSGIVAMMGLLLTGCSSKAASGNEESAAEGSNIIKIAATMPLSGALGGIGASVRNGVDLAVKDNAAALEELGFTLQILPQDDQADPKVGVSIAQKLVIDPDVLAVSASINSGVAIPASPIYAKANLAYYSPAATNPQLTDQGLMSVGRICGRDDNQGQAAAVFALDNLKAASYFVIQDQTAYGQGIADEFVKKADAEGITKLGYEGITVGDTDFSAVINKVVQSKPQVVYFAANYPEGGLFLKQLRDKGSDAIFIGCDGTDSPEMLNMAGSSVEGTYYTTMSPDLTKTAEGQAWIDRYKQTYSKDPEAYSIYAYDTGLTLIKGVEQAITDNGGKKPTREQVSAAIRKITVKGIEGDIFFNSKGDNKGAKSYVLKYNTQKYPGEVVAVINPKIAE